MYQFLEFTVSLTTVIVLTQFLELCVSTTYIISLILIHHIQLYIIIMITIPGTSSKY